MQAHEIADGRDAPEGAMLPRWAYWKVGFALLVCTILVLAAAFFVNSHFRASVGIEPVATQSSAPQAAIAPTAIAQAAPAAQPTASAGLPSEQEILDAYNRFWQVRTDAYLELDPSPLVSVTSGKGLAEETSQLLDYKAQGKALKLDVEHHPLIVNLSADHATVYDEYINRSVLVDPDTKMPEP